MSVENRNGAFSFRSAPRQQAVGLSPASCYIPLMRARNPLYIMAKPPPEVQAQIAALPRNDPGRGSHLLHVTLISLYDLHYAPPEWLPAPP